MPTHCAARLAFLCSAAYSDIVSGNEVRREDADRSAAEAWLAFSTLVGLALVCAIGVMLTQAHMQVLDVEPRLRGFDAWERHLTESPSTLLSIEQSLLEFLQNGDSPRLRKVYELRARHDAREKELREGLINAGFDEEQLNRRAALLAVWFGRYVRPALGAVTREERAAASEALDGNGRKLRWEIAEASRSLLAGVKLLHRGLQETLATEINKRQVLMWAGAGLLVAITGLQIWRRRRWQRATAPQKTDSADDRAPLPPPGPPRGLDITVSGGKQLVRDPLAEGADTVIMERGPRWDETAMIFARRRPSERLVAKVASPAGSPSNPSSIVPDEIPPMPKEARSTHVVAPIPFEQIVSRLPTGLVLFDSSGKPTYINRAGLNILGHTSIESLRRWIEESPGAFGFRHLSQESASLDRFPFSRASRGETFSNYTLHVRRPDNTTRLLSFGGGPIGCEAVGAVGLAVCLFQDASEELALRKELEQKNQELAEAARLKDEFLATVSHELRNPLTPIISSAQLLKTESELDEKDLHAVGLIERNARHLSHMINDMLDLSSAINRKMRLRKEPVEINEWVRSLVKGLDLIWKRKKLDVTLIETGNPLFVDIDATRLAQVVHNLLTNAAKYSNDGGRIEVSVHEDQDQGEIEIRVKDEGVGLAAHELNDIFEMFHQTRDALEQRQEGLGIGLSVARALAELHGGGLRVASEGRGLGSTFSLWLPLAQAELEWAGPNQPCPGERVDTALLRGRRILLIEDSEDTLEALRRILERRECQVLTANNGQVGYDLALREHPEIIISDLGLPGLDGFELISKLRANQAFANLVAICVSGAGREADASEALDAGFDAHLTKPIEVSLLDHTLVKHLRDRQALGVGSVE